MDVAARSALNASMMRGYDYEATVDWFWRALTVRDTLGRTHFSDFMPLDVLGDIAASRDWADRRLSRAGWRRVGAWVDRGGDSVAAVEGADPAPEG